MNPLVSIIVPIYNVEKYIKQCLDSLTNQTYKNLEIILVDDGSKDDSGNICDEYASQDKRIKVIHKQNGGVSSARNLGIDNANGKWITFVDGDDFIDVTMVEKMVEKSCEVDIVFTRMVKDYSDGTKAIFYETCLEKTCLKPYDLQYIIHDRIHYEKDGKFVTDCNHGSSCRTLLNLDIINTNNLRFELGVKELEDRLFIMKYLSLCKTASLVDEYLYHYVINVDSVTHKNKYRPDLFNERKYLLEKELTAINSTPLSEKEKFYLCATQNAKLWWSVSAHECALNPNYKKQLSYYRKNGGVKNPISFKFLFYLKKQGYSLKRVGMFMLIKFKMWGIFKKFLAK